MASLNHPNIEYVHVVLSANLKNKVVLGLCDNLIPDPRKLDGFVQRPNIILIIIVDV